MRAQVCPVCNGRGKIGNNGFSATVVDEKTCHGCNGKGWVEVQEEPLFFKKPYIRTRTQ